MAFSASKRPTAAEAPQFFMHATCDSIAWQLASKMPTSPVRLVSAS